jgi:hypothetical protein
MNLPFDRIHDPLSSYGIIFFPWFGKDYYGDRYWIAYFKDYGFRRTDYNGFHNCTYSGVY